MRVPDPYGKLELVLERAPIASGGGMRRSEEACARVSEEAVRRKGGGGSPRKLGMG
jgi:hypothetical protein